MSLPSTKQVYIRSRRPHHPALCCDRRGKIVYADQFENAAEWTLEHLGNDRYHIIYGEGYLQASPDGKVSCGLRTGNHSDINKEWKIEHTRKGYVSIKSCFRYNEYLCADEDFLVTTNREHCELWEQWAILDMPHLLTTPVREVYIRSCQQQLFCNNEGLPALSHALAPSNIKANCYGPADYSEKWHIVCIDDNKILLKSGNGWYLFSGEDGTLVTIQEAAYNESRGLSWTLENIEGDSKNTVALKSEFGRYLCRDNGDHFMGDGSVKADSTGCRDKCAWWVFLTNSDDVNGNTALEKDAITMKDHNIEYA